MQFIQGQGLDQVIDELRRLREPIRVQETRPPEAGRTAPRADRGRASRPGTREGAEVSSARDLPESLLSGRFASRGSASTDARQGLAGRPRHRPGPGPSSRRPDRPRTAHRDRSASRATHRPRAIRPRRCRRRPPVVELGDAARGYPGLVGRVSGRRAPFFRSVAQIGRQVGAGAWPTPTPAGSSTATSSRRTCCSTPRGWSGSPTSAWPRGRTTG